MQSANGLLRRGLDDIRNEQMPRIDTVQRHMHNGTHLAAVNIGSPQAFHQLRVAGSDLLSVNLRNDAVAADLLHFAYPLPVQPALVRLRRLFQRFPVRTENQTFKPGVANAECDGMRGKDLGMGGQFEQFFVVYAAVVNTVYLKHTLGHGSGFVKGNGFRFGQRLEIVGALYQHALAAGAADAGKEAEGNRNHQRTGAGDDQEGQRAVNPAAPVGVSAADEQKERRQDRQRQGTGADHRGIDLRKTRNEGLGL